MGVTYHSPGLVLTGFLLFTVALIVARVLRGKKNIKEIRGVRVANTARLRNLPLYKQMQRQAKLLRAAMMIGLVIAIVASLFLAARPYRRTTIKEEVQRRDIFVCLDLSASSYKVDQELVGELEDLVNGLQGDRFGVSLFNTSSSLYIPMTDDYKFALQRLGELRKYLDAEEEFTENYVSKYTYATDIPEEERERYDELNDILTSFDQGTTTGYERKGTSAVGEGLASCLFSFPELRKERRTRVILFATDNGEELLEDSLVSLYEAAQMCAADQVTVFGLFPGRDLDLLSNPENNPETTQVNDDGTYSSEHAMSGEDNIYVEDYEDRLEDMQFSVEETGGKCYVVSKDLKVKEILADIAKQEALKTGNAIASQDVDEPAFLFKILAVGFALFALVQIVIFAGHIKGGRKPSSVDGLLRPALVLVALLLVVAIGIRPMVLDKNAEITTGNLDVCFVVDTTISMWAEDYNGNPRMDTVKSDVAKIMEQLPESNFALIQFDNGSQVLSPYTQDANAILNAVKLLQKPGYQSATGSSLNKAYEDLASLLETSANKRGRKAVVFVLSDGEITDGSTLQSYKALNSSVDAGAVLGYGTKKGGRMKYDKKNYIKLTGTGKDARSKIDEENLKSIAKDMDIPYIHRTGKSGTQLQAQLDSIRLMSRTAALQEGEKAGYNETYYLFAGALCVLLMAWFVTVVYRGGVS